MNAKTYIRCMGRNCQHLPGTCTASSEYKDNLGAGPNYLETVSDKPVSFSTALLSLKAGKRITRTGWNGKGMFLYHVPANRYPPTTRAGYDLAAGPDFCVPYRAYVAMKTVDNDVVPWICSQSDMLEDDWLILS